MVNISSAVKKNSGTKATRKELMNKSPIPWLVILGATALAGGLFVYPDAMDWLEKRGSLSEMEENLPTLESQKQDLSLENDNLTTDFESKAKPYIAIANQRYPVEIDKIKISQIMEIYSILKQVNNRQNQIELRSLSIGDPQNIDGLPMASTMVNLNLVIDRPMLEDLVGFIQTGEIKKNLEDKVLRSNGGDTASIEFLKINKLPVGTINNVSLNEERGLGDDNAREVYNAQIQVLFYSEPV